MPVQRCQVDGKPGWKCGQSGKCYPYDPDSDADELQAKKSAIAQCIAEGEDPGHEALGGVLSAAPGGYTRTVAELAERAVGANGGPVGHVHAGVTASADDPQGEVPAGAHYREASTPEISCATCAFYSSTYCSMFDATVGPSMVCSDWGPIQADHALVAAGPKKQPLKRINAHSKAGARRAWEREQHLIRQLKTLLDAAADQAARNFERHATDHLTAAVQAQYVAPNGVAGSGKTMVALYPRPDERAALADSDPDSMHLTLCYIGEISQDDAEKLAGVLQAVAAQHPPLEGKVGGVASFDDNGDGHPSIVLPDVPGLVELRQAVCEAVLDAGMDYSRGHGFTPHLTVAYSEDGPQPPDARLLGEPLHFDNLHVVQGENQVAAHPLTGVPAVTAAASPEPANWSAPAANEVLNVDAVVSTLRTKTDPVRLATIQDVMGPPLAGSGIDFDVTNPLAGKVLAQSGSQITNIAETTQLNAMRVIKASYEQGLSIPDTAKAIRAGMKEANVARATLIARTELSGVVNGASLAATQIVGDATGTGYNKIWLTSPGAQYPRHEEYDGLDNQSRTLDEAFDVGGEALMFPGDPDGSPENVCNCRCTLVYGDEEFDADSGGIDTSALSADEGSTGVVADEEAAQADEELPVETIDPETREVVTDTGEPLPAPDTLATTPAATVQTSPAPFVPPVAGEGAPITTAPTLDAASDIMTQGAMLSSQAAHMPMDEEKIATAKYNWTHHLTDLVVTDQDVIDKVAAADNFNRGSKVFADALRPQVQNAAIVIRESQEPPVPMLDMTKNEARRVVSGQVTLLREDAVTDAAKPSVIMPGDASTSQQGGLPALLREQYGKGLWDTMPEKQQEEFSEGVSAVTKQQITNDLTSLAAMSPRDLYSELFAVASDPQYEPTNWAPWIRVQAKRLFGTEPEVDTGTAAKVKLDTPVSGPTHPDTAAEEVEPTAQLAPADTYWPSSDEAAASALADGFGQTLKMRGAGRAVDLDEIRRSYLAELKGNLADDPSVPQILKEADQINQRSQVWKDAVEKYGRDTVIVPKQTLGPDTEFGKFGVTRRITDRVTVLNESQLGYSDQRIAATLREQYGKQIYADLSGDEKNELLDLLPEGIRSGMQSGSIDIAQEFAQIFKQASDPTHTDVAGWAPWQRAVADKFFPDATRPALPEPRAPAVQGQRVVGNMTVGPVSDSSLTVARAQADEQAQLNFMTRGLASPNASMHDKRYALDEYTNRGEAKKEISQKIAARLEGNEDWNEYISSGARVLGDLKKGEIFEDNYGKWEVIEPYSSDLDGTVLKPLPGNGYASYGTQTYYGQDYPINEAQDNGKIPAVLGQGASKSERASAGLIDQWAATSSDSDRWALAMQHAAADEFGLGEESYQTTLHSIREQSVHAATDQIYDQHAPALRAFLRAMYDQTQQDLKDAGFTDKMTLYRGQGIPDTETNSGFETINTKLQPMSSFSANINVATRFKRDPGGVMGTQVPVSRIIGTCRTGYGCLNEEEFVVLGAPAEQTDQAMIVWNRSTGDAETFWAEAAITPEEQQEGWTIAASAMRDKVIEYNGQRFEVYDFRTNEDGKYVVVAKPASDPVHGEKTEIPMYAKVKKVPESYEERQARYTQAEQTSPGVKAQEKAHAKLEAAGMSKYDENEGYQKGVITKAEYKAITGEDPPSWLEDEKKKFKASGKPTPGADAAKLNVMNKLEDKGYHVEQANQAYVDNVITEKEYETVTGQPVPEYLKDLPF